MGPLRVSPFQGIAFAKKFGDINFFRASEIPRNSVTPDAELNSAKYYIS